MQPSLLLAYQSDLTEQEPITPRLTLRLDFAIYALPYNTAYTMGLGVFQ